MPHRIPLFLTAIAFALAACAPEETLSVSRGQQTFSDNCTLCHGFDGKGTGPVAGDLGAAPPDLTLLSAANGGVFPGTRVMDTVWRDSTDLHRRVMPEFAELFIDDPLVPYDGGDGIETPTPLRLIELAEYLETLQE